ncbi:MAG: hypothetical protein LBW85_02610 [Deltaproteobacteria bacterium]|jgi:hypothetical protein|nr:hypothetical protein [Deltaproteobacteria bacterium]
MDLPLVIEEARARAFRYEGIRLDRRLAAAILSRRPLTAAVLKAGSGKCAPAEEEEEVRCGLWWAHSLKFPETSAAVMELKLRSLDGAEAHAALTA